jgi:hypothetical protein
VDVTLMLTGIGLGRKRRGHVKSRARPVSSVQ